ncbi:hypothetical protein IP70_22170 [alpha proteobacterium AAP38]|nr:hypothetical protein IP70_22170 [alpha proteobacterium AAP38]
MSTDRTSYDVRFADGQVFSGSDRKMKSAAYTAAMVEHHGRAKGEGAVFCLCQGADVTDTKLYISRREKGGTYHLGRYPNTGPAHATDCEFWELPRETSGLDGYDISVVQTLDDGTLKVKLRRPLRQNLQPNEAPATPPPTGTPATGRRSQTAMTTRGALDLLWQTADLNHWRPGMAGKRHSGVVHYHLVLAARKVKASRDLIDDVAVFGFSDMPKPHYADMARRNARVLDSRHAESTPKERRLILVIGTISGVKETVTGYRIVVDGFAHQRLNLEVSLKLLDGLSRMFPVFGRLRAGSLFPGERAVGLFHARIEERPRDGWTRLEADAGAVMAISEQWIPVESSYELTMAQFLVEQQRSFVKPLRYDATEDVLFPDFLLTDCGPPLLPVEVWGRDDADYEARRLVKIEQYKELYPDAPLYEWDATRDDKPPALPPKRSRGVRS